MKFLDKTRVGVWGWGFGGYVTAMVLGSNKKVFKCGIAVSPITDWIYYSECFCSTLSLACSHHHHGTDDDVEHAVITS